MEPVYSLNPDLAWRIIDGEVVILKIKTTTYYSLDSVGSSLWRAMEKAPRMKSELVEEIISEFDVAADTARTDIDELFTDLTREELLIEKISDPVVPVERVAA